MMEEIKPKEKKKMNWFGKIMLGLSLLLLVFAFTYPFIFGLILGEGISENLAVCLNESIDTLYVYGINNNPGCPRCGDQLEVFGERLEHINWVECFEQPTNCTEIYGMPYLQLRNGRNYTFLIENSTGQGYFTEEILKNITGCWE